MSHGTSGCRAASTSTMASSSASGLIPNARIGPPQRGNESNASRICRTGRRTPVRRCGMKGLITSADTSDEQGDALVPSACIFDGFRLGQWVTVQRRSWDRLDDNRRKRLSDLPGWAVSARDAQWEESFRRIAEYARMHGEASPPQSYADADGHRLGRVGSEAEAGICQGSVCPAYFGETPESSRLGLDPKRDPLGGQLPTTSAIHQRERPRMSAATLRGLRRLPLGDVGQPPAATQSEGHT